MAVRSKYTFEKRQKENLRRQKKEEKVARRMEAKHLRVGELPEGDTPVIDSDETAGNPEKQEETAEPGTEGSP